MRNRFDENRKRFWLWAALGQLAAIAVLAGCDREDWHEGLARMPANLVEAACLKAGNCTVYCEDGSIKSNTFPYWCRRD